MNSTQESNTQTVATSDLKKLVQDVFEEFHSVQSRRTEPAHKAELEDERRKREILEKRLRDREIQRSEIIGIVCIKDGIVVRTRLLNSGRVLRPVDALAAQAIRKRGLVLNDISRIVHGGTS